VPVRFPETRALFERLAELDYERVSEEHGYGAVVAWVREQCALFRSKDPAILDLGCADGRIGAVIAEARPGARLVGIDFSSAMLEKCRARRLYAELVEADLNLAFPIAAPPRFDLVVACGLFEFIEDGLKLLNDTKAVVMPGGELWVTFELALPGATSVTSADWKFPVSEDAAIAMVEAASYHLIDAQRRIAYSEIQGLGEDLRIAPTGNDVTYLMVRARA
jgi:predicted TPR repeat methyltransferase